MSVLICPNCKKPLKSQDKTYTCENKHSFDISKEGYVNLLIANKKKNPNPGDNKQMVRAREAFLSEGHYDFLLQHIRSILVSFQDYSDITHKQLLDLGCGTGYYTRHLFKAQSIDKIGIDLSKPGIAQAAKKDKHSKYIVGSIFDIPVRDHAVDIVVNIFAPLDIDECLRVLKEHGTLIKVIPIGNHMKEIATKVYDQFKPHTSTIESDLKIDNSFKIIASEVVTKSITLSDQGLYNFIAMTPYFYKFKDDEIKQLSETIVTLSFKFIIAQKIV